MKKLFGFLFIIISLAASGFAQSIPVSAKIVNTITYTGVVSMDFGTCAIGTDNTTYKLGVDNLMNTTGTGAFHIGSNLSGRIRFMGNPGDNATITVQMPSGLSDATLSEYTYGYSDNASYTGVSPTSFGSGTPFTIPFNSSGDIYLSLGAKLTVIKGTTTIGSKSGTINITCIYQ
jgi:hypothetical protein